MLYNSGWVKSLEQDVRISSGRAYWNEGFKDETFSFFISIYFYTNSIFISIYITYINSVRLLL